MEKYKVCPVCGIRNNPLLLECTDCETDLQNVPVVDEAIENSNSNENGAPSCVTEPVMVRVCDCGSKNPVQARKCSACGEDISMIVPTPDRAEGKVKFILSSLDGSFAFEVQSGKTLIGREHEMKEYLQTRRFVSRKHAELHLDLDANELSLINSNCSNYTFVNNKMISGDNRVVLHDGDEIGLGGNEQNGSRQSDAAYFIVRIGACT